MVMGPTLGFVLDRTNHNYRYTFTLGFIASVAALAVMFIVHRNFMRHGGPKGYVAPGDAMPA